MSIIPADQVRTLTPPPSWQETRRENRRQIRQARRKARADAAEKRTRERETAVTSLRDRTERASAGPRNTEAIVSRSTPGTTSAASPRRSSKSSRTTATS